MVRDRVKRLSTKSKNKWLPPDRWGKQKKAISPLDSEEEEDEGDTVTSRSKKIMMLWMLMGWEKTSWMIVMRMMAI